MEMKTSNLVTNQREALPFRNEDEQNSVKSLNMFWGVFLPSATRVMFWRTFFLFGK